MSDVILTSEHLESWNAEITKQAAVMAKAKAKIDNLKAKLDLVASLTGKKVKLATDAPATRTRKPKDEGEGTFSSAIVKVLDDHWGQQISHTEIQAELKAAGYGEILERNPTYYYNLISKLVKKGMLTKSGRSHFNVSPGTPSPEPTTNGATAAA